MRFATIPLVGLVLVIAACDQAYSPTLVIAGGHTSTSTSDSTVTITLSPAGPQIAIAATVQLSTSAASTLQPLRWTTSNAAVATVSSTGIVTGVSAGSATITVVSTTNAAATGATIVTVTGF